MLVIPTSSSIDSWIYADYSTNGQQLVGGISQPCGIGFPEDALSDLYVSRSCNPVRTEACDLHAIRNFLAAGSAAEAQLGSDFIPSVLSSALQSSVVTQFQRPLCCKMFPIFPWL